MAVTTAKPERAHRAARSSLVAGAALAAAVIVTPAQAGRWITGGTFDAQLAVGVSFLRYLADTGEGQMTIRCDDVRGLWIDAGVGGNGELPPGVVQGATVALTLTFAQAGGPVKVTVNGTALVRGDGAVLVSVEGAAVAPLGPILLVPTERVDIMIAGTSRAVPMTGALEGLTALAQRCRAWPN